MRKYILVAIIFSFMSACYAQEQYINLNKSYAAVVLKRTAKRNKLKILMKQTDSTIVCVIRDSQKRDMIMILYFDKYWICNKVLEMYKVDSCYKAAFDNMLNEKRFEWTKIMPGTYLSNYSKRLLLFENPNAPFSYILQHNKYMTREQYDDLMPKLVP